MVLQWRTIIVYEWKFSFCIYLVCIVVPWMVKIVLIISFRFPLPQGTRWAWQAFPLETSCPRAWSHWSGHTSYYKHTIDFNHLRHAKAMLKIVKWLQSVRIHKITLALYVYRTACRNLLSVFGSILKCWTTPKSKNMCSNKATSSLSEYFQTSKVVCLTFSKTSSESLNLSEERSLRFWDDRSSATLSIEGFEVVVMYGDSLGRPAISRSLGMNLSGEYLHPLGKVFDAGIKFTYFLKSFVTLGY